ncbi:Protein amnionless [Eufriesea mexicana]|uniref:Protein amnionless n=1 Tax=Eufriesea mexicana TaxID=516756 RepID=A0A310SC47_9HYME|nr:Protein amnionless [Eufriesea mexicana]
MRSAVVKRFWTPWIFFALTIKSSCSVDKYWLPNLEWETPENWVGKRIPELDSFVTFPLDMRHAVGIGSASDLRLSGVDLPRSGALVLPRNGKLQLSEPKTPRKTSEWLRAGNLFWADPQNWNGSSEAAPHLEQVPCLKDNIVLPAKNRTFSTLLPLKNIEVWSIRLNGEKQPLNEGQWMRLRNSREFAKGIFTVMYAEYHCEKCACQIDPDGYYLEEVCAIERPRCGYTPCEYPLTVEGHCCQYCGARVSLTDKAPMLMVDVATDVALTEYAGKLAWHVRRTWNGAVEVLLKTKGGNTMQLHRYAEYHCEKCACQIDPDGYYLEEVCAIERPRCGYTPCEYPLTVEGHCCQYCGARVSLTDKAPMLMVDVATDVALTEYAGKLAWHVRRTWNGAVEVLLKTKGGYSEIDVLKAAQDVKHSLLNMNIEVLNMEVTGAALKDNRLTVALVPFFTTPFIILLVVFLGCIYFGYTYRHILVSCTEFFSSIRDGVRADKAEGGKPFSFARFENISEGNVQISNVDVTSEPKEVQEEEGQDPTSGGRFENPLYRSKRRGRKEDEEVLGMEALMQLTTLKDKMEEQLEEVEINMDE